MFYLYCLQSLRNNKLYIGSTSNLRKRFDDHNKGSGGDFTSKNGPWKLIYYEAFLNKKDARSAEKYYKSGFGRETMKKKMFFYLQEDRSA